MKHRSGHLFKRGDVFYLSWRINGKKFTKALRSDNGDPITTKREAEEARVKVMAPFTVGDEKAALESVLGKLQGCKAELAQWDDELNPPLSIVQGWSEFLGSPNRPDSGPSTLRQYEFQWDAFETWMKKKHADKLTIRDVSKPLAEDYAASLNHSRLSASTYNKHLNLLTLVFRVLKHKAKILENPWEEIQRKRLVVNSRRELTIDELKRVCAAAEGELRTLLALGLYTGLRLGDCATLRWGEVDLDLGLIRRIPNKTARRNPKPVLVPIHPVLSGLLAETPAKQRRDYVLPNTAEQYQLRTDLVTDTVQQHFRNCEITLHKVGTGTEGKRAVIEVGFHSLRHSFVSLCRASNAPLAVVESIVGHSSPAMTRHYTHTGELEATRAVALLPTIIGDPKASRNSRPSEPEKVLLEAQHIARSITAKNWKAKKATLLALLDQQRG